MLSLVLWHGTLVNAVDHIEDDKVRTELLKILKRKDCPNEMLKHLQPYWAELKMQFMEVERKLLKSPKSIQVDKLKLYLRLLFLESIFALTTEQKHYFLKNFETGLNILSKTTAPTEYLELQHRNLFAKYFTTFQMVEVEKKNLIRAKKLFDHVRQLSGPDLETFLIWMKWTPEEFDLAVHREHVFLIDSYVCHYDMCKDKKKTCHYILLQLKHILNYDLIDSMLVEWIYGALDCSKFCDDNIAQSTYILRAAEVVLEKYGKDPKALAMYPKGEMLDMKGRIMLAYALSYISVLLQSSKDAKTKSTEPKNHIVRFEKLAVPDGDTMYDAPLSSEDDIKKLILHVDQLIEEATTKLRNKQDELLSTISCGIKLVKKFHNIQP